MMKRTKLLIAVAFLAVSAIGFLPSQSYASTVRAMSECDASCSGGDCTASGWFCRCRCNGGVPECECVF